MPLLFAYLAVILIWSSTPLAIQLSQQELPFYTALSLRMWGSAILSMPILMLLRQSLIFTPQALMSYVAGAVGVYGAMICVYWGAVYVPSGLISVMYGLSPMLSGLLAYFWLQERELTPARVIALTLAITGLYVVVSGQLSFGGQAWRGILGTLISVSLFSMSAVLVKRINAGLHPVVQTSGTLWVSSLGFAVTLPFFGIQIPDNVSLTNWLGLGYLMSCGSLLGFVLYFYILKHLPTARVALITLIAPVLAVLWGSLLKDEVWSLAALMGGALMLFSLALYQWHLRLDKVLRNLYRWFITLLGHKQDKFKQKKS
ncbi:MAG: DMT family transporter [Oleispira sp.]|nr:DMT family transporter [Oleispira sp.]MBL4882616.1 DMT family transporter [Oleispira sp.]